MRTEAESSSETRWDLASSQSHGVQFYEDEAFLLEGLSKFIGTAILGGGSAVVIATKAQRESLPTHLRSRGLDLTIATKEGRYLSLDAAETLATFMVDGEPQFEPFVSEIGEKITRLACAARGEKRQVVAFGQMVALLWAEGKAEAAIRLEQFWNRLAQTHSFQLYCSYPIHLFSREQDSEVIKRICAEHSHVIPTEHYSSVPTEQGRLHAIVLLQQKAQALASEVLERKKAQRSLQDREAELKDFLENAVIGMHWVGADGTILWANKAELAMLGFEYDEYVGHPISEFHADQSVIQDILQRLGHNEELHGYEARLRCKDGSIREVRIDSNFFRPDQGAGHTRCFTTDITEKKQAERKLFHLAAIVESSDDAIVGKDLNGIITSWNLGAERIFGYRSHEIVGKPVLFLIPPELQQDEIVILSKIRAGQRIDHFQTVRLHKDGRRIDVSLTVSPVRDRDGQIIGAAKILRDITEQKKLEGVLRVTERLASVGRLAATVAHEINNPLESVVNLLYLTMHTEGLPETARRNLVIADQELARVAHIAQQTLGFYRDTAHPTWVSMTSLVDSILRVYERRMYYKGITVEQRIAPELEIFAHQGELKQVLSNLLSNAIDASRQHGKIWIRAHASAGGSKRGPGIRITLADNGSGIPAEVVGRVFMPFFTTKADVGTGIGLWVTRNLIEKHGGSIQCRSSQESSSGTVMSIFVPRHIPEKKSLIQTVTSELQSPLFDPPSPATLTSV